ncbi:hypothetical protein PIB30_079491 [Stylosanthes scabra]|uniref:GDSL esterase/lipase n=1 Tax=Stylosanthes scabra TaxID=79078 RepID=A0ABU6XP66_9FABA|nr:hypothetical protein [Stylosanthes scabra]
MITRATTTANKVPAIIVFGDSTVDAGNNNFIPTVARSNFEPYGRDFAGGKPTGRFSNGRIATDFISEAFGLKPYIPAYLDPKYKISDFATGVSFASAATGYDNATSDVLPINDVVSVVILCHTSLTISDQTYPLPSVLLHRCPNLTSIEISSSFHGDLNAFSTNSLSVTFPYSISSISLTNPLFPNLS